MLGISMRIPRAHSCPVRTIFRRMIVRINRRGGPDAEHSFHSTDDTPYDASYRPSDDRTNRASCLVADRRAVGDPAGHSLGLSEA